MADAGVRLRVGGMTCGHCTSTVHNALSAVPGVGAVNVDLLTGEAEVHMTDPSHEDAALLAQLVQALGYDAEVMLLSGDAHEEQHTVSTCIDLTWLNTSAALALQEYGSDRAAGTVLLTIGKLCCTVAAEWLQNGCNSAKLTCRCLSYTCSHRIAAR
jgi:copper chaperone CopZ